MTEPRWSVDPGATPPTRHDAWFPSVPPAPVADLFQSFSPAAAFTSQPIESPHLESTSAPLPPSLRRRGGQGRLAASLIIGLFAVAAVGFVAGRASSGSSPSEVLANAAAVGGVTHTVGSNGPRPLKGNEANPAEAVAKLLTPSAVQLQGKDDLGSGFIYDSSGLILTAAHVVAGNTEMQVRLADGTQTTGTVVGANAATDIAVIRIKVDKQLVAASLGSDDDVNVGQVAIALGSPYGLDQTVTAGIVSAVGRSVSTQDGGEVAMLQTDAPINPGNSGGMLANAFGQVIGVNDSIITGSDPSAGDSGNVGVGFAIPIGLAKSVADRLVAGRPIEFGYLGVTTKNSAGARAGGYIEGVVGGSPGAKAGLKSGDIVIKVDGNPIGGGTDLAAAIRARKPGDKVRLTVLRGSSELAMVATVGKS